MDNKIEVLNIKINLCTAKEAMKKAVDYMKSDLISVIEFVTPNSIMALDENDELKSQMDQFELILAGEKALFDVLGVKDENLVKEVEERRFLRLFFQYLHKQYKRVYLLVEAEKDAENIYEHFSKSYRGIEIVGIAKVAAANRADMMLVNAINGSEVDCIISTLSTPLQEDFVTKNKNLMNARVWLGLGKKMLDFEEEETAKRKLAKYLMKKILKKEIEKQKRS